MSDARVAAAALREAADVLPTLARKDSAESWGLITAQHSLRDRADAIEGGDATTAEHPTRARLRALIDQRRLDADDLPAPVSVEELRAILDET